MGLDELDWRAATTWCEHIFERVGDPDNINGLGDKPEVAENEYSSVSRCFNCGSPQHTVRSCPDPSNHALIALSRALFQFHRQSNVADTERFHVAEDWKLQRFRWLDDFAPGQVRGELLRDALCLSEGDLGEDVPWLYNMLEWGYPPGWASTEDPRDLVLDRISSGGEANTEGGLGEFSIFGEGEEMEILSLHPDPTSQATAVMETASESCSSFSSQHSRDSFTEAGDKLLANASPGVRRWATYQTSLFSSELLPVYNGRPLPPLGDDAPNSLVTGFEEKARSIDPPNKSIGHPWRHPDAFSAFGPVGWMKMYEEVLVRRSQVEQDSQADESLSYSRSLAHDSEVDNSLAAGIEDDMDLSD